MEGLVGGECEVWEGIRWRRGKKGSEEEKRDLKRRREI